MVFVNKSSMWLGGGVKSNYSVSAFHIHPDCSLQQFLIFFFSRDSFDFPSYPQSFDIAVSPGISRNSKSQGKGDRSRREKCVTFTYLPFRVVFNPLTPRSKVYSSLLSTIQFL